MEAYLLDRQFKTLDIVEFVRSIVWTERYTKAGDFELVADASTRLIEALPNAWWICLAGNNTVMAIDRIETEEKPGETATVKLSGGSLENILSRRVAFPSGLYELATPVATIIYEMITTSCMKQFANTPTDLDRIFPGFDHVRYKGPRANTLLAGDYKFKNLREAVEDVLSAADLGDRVVLEDGKLTHELYPGRRRIPGQDGVDSVMLDVMAGDLEHFRSVIDRTKMKNAAIVTYNIFPNNTPTELTLYADWGKASGYARREMFVAQNNQKHPDESEYIIAQQKAAEAFGKGVLLKEYAPLTSDGAVARTSRFKMGVDFGLGDVVGVRTSISGMMPFRVVEIVTTMDETGVSAYPTLAAYTERKYE